VKKTLRPLLTVIVLGLLLLPRPGPRTFDSVTFVENAQAQVLTFTIVCNGSADTAKFTNAITSLGANKAKLSVAYRTTPCVVNSFSVPANITLDLTNAPGISVNTGQTLTVLSDADLWPKKKLFYNATAGLGTISFTGNKSIATFYPEWWGPVGDGTTNDSAPFAAFLAAIPDGATGFITPRSTYLFTTGFTMTARSAIRLTSGVDAQNYRVAAPRLIWNGTGGTMFDLEICQAMHIEGIYFKNAAGKSIDTFIKIDGVAGAQISTLNFVEYNAFDAGSQSNANAKLVSICPTCTGNNENMTVSHNDFACSSGVRAAAAGIGINNGNNPNAKHQRFDYNRIQQCAIGIRLENGSFGVDHFGGGANNIDIQVLDTATEPIVVSHLETEGSAKALDIRHNPASLTCQFCRFSNGNQTTAFVTLGGMVTLLNCKIDFLPGAGQTFFAPDGSGVIRLVSINNLYSYNAGITMAQLGFDYFSSASVSGEFTGNNLISINDWQITDAPSLYYFQYGGTDFNDGKVANFYFGSPIQFKSMTLAKLTANAQPNGTFAYCSDCTIANPCAGGGTGAIAKRLNNTWICN
jgi:hypothetical protein